MARGKSRRDPDVAKAEDDIIRCLRAQSFTVAKMAAGLRRTTNHVERRIKALGLARPVLTAPAPIDGEEWVDRPDLGIRVSSLGRFASLKTGQALSITSTRGRPYVTVKTGSPQQTTRSVRLLVAECFGGAVNDSRYSAIEDQAIKRARSISDACAALPNRTREGIRRRARLLGHKLAASTSWRGAEVRGSVPYEEPHWRAANAIVPRGMPDHVRDDLISDFVLRRLEGETGDDRQLLKRVMTDRNRLVGAFRERSIDAPFRPGSDFSILHTLADDCERF